MYLITYELIRPAKEYLALFQQIKDISEIWWHNLNSAWIIKHKGPSTAILRALKPYVHPRDKLLVIKLDHEAAGIGFHTQASQWVKINLE